MHGRTFSLRNVCYTNYVVTTYTTSMNTLKKSGLVSLMSLAVVALFNHVALAAGTCTVNGKDVPCEEALKYLKAFFGLGIGFIIGIVALGIWASVFWLLMIIHAATHEIENRPMWIIILIFTHVLGALIYYFAVKRPFNNRTPGM